MANWEKLNKKFDDVIDSMSKEDWKNWKKRCDERRLERENLKPEIKEENPNFDMLYKSVRSSKLTKARRTRECFECGCKIYKNEQYLNHQFRYDGRIITINFCLNCK